MSESKRDKVFKKLIEAVDLGDEDLAAEWANKALADGVLPLLLSKGNKLKH